MNTIKTDSTGSLKRMVRGRPGNTPNRAPVELQLEWLKAEIGNVLRRVNGLRVDTEAARAVIGDDDPLLDAKLKERVHTLNEIGDKIEWLLGARRPWMKPPNVSSSATGGAKGAK